MNPEQNSAVGLETPAKLTVSKDEAEEAVDVQIVKGEKLSRILKNVSTTDALEDYKLKYKDWDHYNKTLLARFFTPAEPLKAYKRANFSGVMVIPTRKPSLEEQVDERRQWLDKKLNYLKSLKNTLSMIARFSPGQESPTADRASNRVLILGDTADEKVKTGIKKLMKELDLEPVSPGGDVTVVELFEAEKPAVSGVMMFWPGEDYREEAVFNLGYLLGKLGRGRVCLLHFPEEKVPDSVSEVNVFTLDKEGKWEPCLGKTLDEARPYQFSGV